MVQKTKRVSQLFYKITREFLYNLTFCYHISMYFPVLRAVAISAVVPHHLFHGNLPGAGTLVDDALPVTAIA